MSSTEEAARAEALRRWPVSGSTGRMFLNSRARELFELGAAWQRTQQAVGPARIVQMPPSPETNARYWEVHCPVCTTHECMFDGDDPRLVERRDEHNRRHAEQPLPGSPTADTEDDREALAVLISEYIDGTDDCSDLPKTRGLADKILSRFRRRTVEPSEAAVRAAARVIFEDEITVIEWDQVDQGGWIDTARAALQAAKEAEHE